ncbi:nucleolar protein 12 [Salvia hispanica]|uniref:nucleolar protein 12 n=1 Tax=Salvia hispanica TaxID=49212 RepID=UPI0020090E31|nr:nucleolar protein 12 [Salvia hispanica]
MDMAAATAEEGGAPLRTRHIKKRALRNKSLSVSFDEKDLKDFVGGFHKRKKKRRKEALQQQEEAGRRKRIELRKKRKLEREFVMSGGVPVDPSAVTAKSDEEDEQDEQDEDSEPVVSVSGTMMYDNDDVQVIVTTSEISREEVLPVDKYEVEHAPSVHASETGKQKTPVVRKKQLKKAPMKRSRPKIQRKREKRKGNNKEKRR